MKLRKGWLTIWPDGTEWWGDCPKWAAAGRKAGYKVVPMRILGPRSWNCDCVSH